MPRRDKPVHVATIRRVHKGKVYETHLLRRTFRREGKVCHETLGNLSHLPRPIIDLIRGALRGETYVSAEDRWEILRTRPHGHVAAVLGTLRQIGLEDVLASRPSRERDLVVGLVVARLLDPRSKLATARGLREETAFSTLGETLGLEAADEDDLYAALDWLEERQARIENKLARRHLSEGCLVLYDVTSSYYTGRHCPLARFGHSRDGKRGFPQILYGLLCSGEGCPIAMEVFEGNLADPKTLGVQVEKLRKRFGLQRVVLVGDRGMITDARIKETLSPVEGLSWITAFRAPAIRRLAEAGRLQLSLFDEQDLAEITSPEYPNERLIVCRNPLLADERARKREELLQATEKRLEEVRRATAREKRPLRGREQIGLRLGRVINHYKMAKHFRLKITETSFSYERRREKIAAEAALDGIYVIRTNVPADEMSASQAVRNYKRLSTVERAFRCLKTVDLHVRPIHHRAARRVRAHIFLCMLAYYVEWHMRQRLAPLLFEDSHRDLGEARRSSIVAPARRSLLADAKAQTKRTEEGLPVHSFRTLLQDLQTIARNRVRPRSSGSASGAAAEFDVVTSPTAVQRRALELLGVSLTQ